MAQVAPAYRRIAERAERQWSDARRRRLPADVTAYLKENAESWDMVAHNITLTTMVLKSFGTGDRTEDMLNLTLAKADRFAALIPPEQD